MEWLVEFAHDERCHVEDEFRSKTGVFEDMANIEYSVNDAVTVELYGKQIAGRVIKTHNPGDGYGQSVEVELREAWRGAKKLWFQAKDVAASSVEGLVSLQLGEHSVQFDEQSGELLIAGQDGQLLLSGEEAHQLCDFLIGLRAGNAIDYSEVPF